jgi:MFS family permease
LTGSAARGAAVWTLAGTIGASIGPALGGLLTELVSWQSIFLLQVPVALAAAVPILTVAKHEAATGVIEPELRETGRPHLWANLALAMVSAAIMAALFLLVLLLIEGWRLSPIEAALVVSVMPLAAILSSRLGEMVPDARSRAAAGAILVSGGLAGLAFLPKATIALTIAPQVLVGIGLALVLSALTETALGGRAPQAIHGGWTIASRHAGVMIGLLILTPIFTADINQQRHDAIDAGTAVILDSPINPLLKLDLAERVSEQLEREKGKVPTIEPAFEPKPTDPAQRAEVDQLQGELQDQLDRGATHAFSTSFLLAALLGLIALFPIALSRRVDL